MKLKQLIKITPKARVHQEHELISIHCNIEEVKYSCKGLFDLMNEAYIFLEHCGTEG